MFIGGNGRISSTGGLRQEHVPRSNDMYGVSLWSRTIHCFFDTEFQACFPEAMSKLLPDLDTYDVITVVEFLRIEVSRCTPSQLNTLITYNIVDRRATICNLISESNLERLYFFANFFYRTWKSTRGLPNPLPIYHTICSRTNGYFYPHYREFRRSPCIMCSQCLTMLDPRNFVSHYHLNLCDPDPNFSPYRWRDYIHVVEVYQTDILCMRVLTELKYKF